MLCLNKQCGHEFPTEKEEPQCGRCGLRFIAVSNSIIPSKTQSMKQVKQENQIKEIGELLTELSDKYEKTGLTIQEIRKIVRDGDSK